MVDKKLKFLRCYPPQNAAKAVKSGMALQLKLKTIDKATLKATILEMLTNKTYREAAQLRSRNFRDQPEKPIDRALWWVDYVARSSDLTFLKSQKLGEMNYFVKHSMDVVAFLVILILVVLLGTIKVVCVLRKVCKKKGGGKEKKLKVK